MLEGEPFVILRPASLFSALRKQASFLPNVAAKA